jgi:uroporphyrinogen-III synthase
LDGVRVLVTRPEDPDSDFVQQLERSGAEVVSLPLISIGPPPNERELREAAAAAERYDWLAFTSTAGVDAFVRRRSSPLPAGAPRLAAVGPSTARAVRDAFGRNPDVVPEEHSGEALAGALLAHMASGQSILIAQAADARPVLATRLRAARLRVTTVAAYSTVPIRPPDIDERIEAADALVFASGSAVQSLVAALGPHAAARLRGKLVACIGPVTSLAARESGLHVEIVPASATLASLVEALCTYYTTRPGTR